MTICLCAIIWQNVHDINVVSMLEGMSHGMNVLLEYLNENSIVI